MKRLRITSSLLGAALLACLAGLAAAEPSAWFRLEFADRAPVCADATASRCTDPHARLIRFEVRDGERIEMLSGSGSPPAWTAFDAVWVYAPTAVDEAAATIELTAMVGGARLRISDQGRHHEQTLPIRRWVALGGDTGLWVRVTPH